MDENEDKRDWGNVRFRRDRHRRMRLGDADPAQTRFVIGLGVFVVVALIYPWYSYRLQAYLLARDLEVGLQQINAEMDAVTDQMKANTARRQQASAQQVQARREEQARQRVAGVRVMGVNDGRSGPVVIVDLGQASVGQATARICSQTERSLGRSLDGVSIRLQRYRGSQPALDAGQIRC